MPIVIFFRLFFAPFIFISVLWAITMSVFLDWMDSELFKRAGYPYSRYNFYDKLLDYYWYIFIIAYVLLKAVPLKGLFLYLFLLRSIGQGLYFLTKKHFFFFLFPNIFEPLFWIYVLTFLFPSLGLFFTYPNIMWLMLILLLIKLFNEYIIHIARVSVYNLVFFRKPTLWVEEKNSQNSD